MNLLANDNAYGNTQTLLLLARDADGTLPGLRNIPSASEPRVPWVTIFLTCLLNHHCMSTTTTKDEGFAPEYFETRWQVWRWN